MATSYTINYTDPATPSFVIGPGQANTAHSVRLFGVGTLNYGEHINENFIHLLENFAYSVAPLTPIKGQIWYDTTSQQLKIYNGTTWIGAAVVASATSPAAGTGRLWYDTVASLLKVYNGTSWVSVASDYVLKAGDTMTGSLVLNSDPVTALGAATKQYVDNTTVSLTGDTMTGLLVLSADPTALLGAATKQYVDTGLGTKSNTSHNHDTDYINVSGDTMTGYLVLHANPAVALGAATKQYVDSVAASSFTTGDIKFTLKMFADTGWIMMNDGTIGSAVSGATTRANADTEPLFTLIWDNISDTYAPVSGGRGASASADFAAGKTIQLTRVLGRALGVAGAGSGLTSRALGQYLGAETHTLTQAETPLKDHYHTGANYQLASGTDGSAGYISGAPSPAGAANTTTVGDPTATPHNNMQPTTFLNVMVKL